MGNEHSVVKNLDKRTARREHASHFKRAIDRYRAYNEKHLKSLGILGIEGTKGHHESRDEENSAQGISSPRNADSVVDMKVCVRKRPIFEHELHQGEYDVVTCLYPHHNAKVVIHDARMHPDMKRMFVDHHAFGFDNVFNETANNKEVYQGTAAPLVKQAVKEQVISTVMMYGQTGSGKTYTMSAIYQMACYDLFEALETEGRVYSVTMSFVELAGDRCSDMLNRGRTAQLLTGRDGAVHPYPTAEIEVGGAEELYCYIQFACSLRATEATGVHDHSSRSHAICRIYIKQEGDEEEGVLQLVDLAGSEQRIDSDAHGPARRKESAQINSSLSALKECIRCKAAKGKFMPYRKSKLTHCLRSCFDERNPTRVIATVSPSSKDTEHSLNTLRHANIMDGKDPGAEDQNGSSHVTGGHVDREMIGELDLTQLARQKRAERLGGQQVKEANKESTHRMGSEELSLAEVAKVREKQLAAAERSAYKSLKPDRQKQLNQARQQIGDNPRQNRRLLKFSMQIPHEDPEEAPPALQASAQDWPVSQQDSSADSEGPRAKAADLENFKAGQHKSVKGAARPSLSQQGQTLIDSEGRTQSEDNQTRLTRQSKPAKTEGNRFAELQDTAQGQRPAANVSNSHSAVDKQQEVARRRKEVEDSQRRALEEKIQNKARRASGAMKPAQMGIEKIEDEIASLSEELKAPGLGQPKAFAIKKKIAMCKAELLKLQRKRDVEHAAAAAESQNSTEPNVADSLETLEPIRMQHYGGTISGRDSDNQARQPVQGGPSLAANRRAMGTGALQAEKIDQPRTAERGQQQSGAMQRTPSWGSSEQAEGTSGDYDGRRIGLGRTRSQGGHNPDVRSRNRLEGAKNIQPQVLAMLEEDAEAFREVILARGLSSYMKLWRSQAEMRAMSYR